VPHKSIVIAKKREPSTFGGYIGQAGTAGGAGLELHIAHARLTVLNDQQENAPVLAVETISTEKGTWRVNPDGSMEAIWRIHPNVRWHDGTPMTSADLSFAFTVNKDPAIPATEFGAQLRLIDRVETPDPYTAIVHWNSMSTRAAEAPGLMPQPRHLLEDLYRADKDAFVRSPHWTTEFVGLGPYRLVNWAAGSHMEFTRFQDYFKGRPALDRVEVRYINDDNTMVANVLAGSVDLLFEPGISVDAVLEAQQRWQGTANIARADQVANVARLDIQFRPNVARPSNGHTNLQVRQALYYGLDRRVVAEVMTRGLAAVADSWHPPFAAMRPQVESAIPQYPYDPARAQQMLMQAGWVKGTDGMLGHRDTGARYETDLWGEAGEENVLLVLADQWKSLGARLSPFILSAALGNDREYVATYPFARFREKSTPSTLWEGTLHGGQISAAENRWSSRNQGGYSNSSYDAIRDKLVVTIDPREQVALHRELVQVGIGDLATYPLYWAIWPMFQARGIKGPGTAPEAGWNIWEWDRD